ncbi:MAG: cbb3-type cytochrome c oxidase subunit I [Anaerolineales bacterium]
MPSLSRWMVRFALVYLLLGGTFGALILANKGASFEPRLWLLLPTHIETMFVGWMTQFAMGISFWILPRFGGRNPRGDERLIWLAFWLINLGIGLVVLSQWLNKAQLALIGRSVEMVAWLSFIGGVWKRIYPFMVTRYRA